MSSETRRTGGQKITVTWFPAENCAKVAKMASGYAHGASVAPSAIINRDFCGSHARAAHSFVCAEPRPRVDLMPQGGKEFRPALALARAAVKLLCVANGSFICAHIKNLFDQHFVLWIRFERKVYSPTIQQSPT